MQQVMNGLNTWFERYADSFCTGNPETDANIVLKKDHSLRVCNEIRHIGTWLGLRGNALHLAEVIGLLHDIGRFEQYSRYHTFVDKRSEDHASLGERVLREIDLPEKWPEEAQELVFRSIRYHNRAELPAWEEERCLFFSRLLRDADKLDIWRVVTEYYDQCGEKRNGAIELGLPDSAGFSGEVYDELMHEKIVSLSHIRNFNDFKLLQVGWIYDLNFPPSFQKALERRYLDKIRKALPDSSRIDELFAHARSYAEKGVTTHPPIGSGEPVTDINAWCEAFPIPAP